MHTNIRTRYQRAAAAAVLAGLLEQHADPKVAAIAAAIRGALSAPMEIVGCNIAKCCVAYPEIIPVLLKAGVLTEAR